MHGLIFAELKKYAQSRLGDDSWPAILDEAGLAGRVFQPVEEYADSDAMALIAGAAKMSGRPSDVLLEDFGRFIVPDLLKMYGALLDRSWTTLDIIEHTEQTIHRVVRSRNPGARPPELHCTRSGPEAVVIRYASARRLCAMAKGIVRGLAEHYAETVAITEPMCMLRGDVECRISVRRSA